MCLMQQPFLILFSDNRIFISRTKIRASGEATTDKMPHFILVQIHSTGIAFVVLVIEIIHTDFTVTHGDSLYSKP